MGHFEYIPCVRSQSYYKCEARRPSFWCVLRCSVSSRVFVQFIINRQNKTKQWQTDSRQKAKQLLHIQSKARGGTKLEAYKHNPWGDGVAQGSQTRGYVCMKCVVCLYDFFFSPSSALARLFLTDGLPPSDDADLAVGDLTWSHRLLSAALPILNPHTF